MAVSVVMPALEMAQETGKVISWLKKEGDAIARDWREVKDSDRQRGFQ